MMVEMLIQTMIQAMYPGGITEFDREFQTFITRDNKLVIAVTKEGSKLEPELLKKFEEGTKGLGIEVVYTSASNFQDYDDMREAEADFNEVLNKNFKKFQGRMQIAINQALMDVIAKDYEKDSEEGRELNDAILALEGVCNYRIEYKDKTVFAVCSDKKAEGILDMIHSRTLETGRPERDININQDDQMNLKIALGAANTVEEFLEMI